jgi:hypothetical protein
MKKRLKKVVAYITRSWRDEPTLHYPSLRIFSPFLIELLAYLIGLAILYKLGTYLWAFI